MAVKVLKREGSATNQLKNIENEVSVLMKSKHRNIVTLKDKMRSENSYYLVLEYCNGGDLAELKMIRHSFNEEEVRLIATQIIDGMLYLQSIGVLHRDLKPANMLIHFPNMTGKES
jgi:serine/threonine protein kinase